MMLNAIFGASTGGMFLIGFALQLGANDVILGLMSTIPQFFVVFQFLAAFFVERGYSRKRMTVIFAFLTPLGWVLIAAIPLAGTALGTHFPLVALIAVIALVTLCWQFSGNARSSWIGDLIPPGRRGRFFGNCALFAGLVGAVFAVGEGRFLDAVKAHGLFAFAALFFFGVIFGLASAFLNLPQPDCPLPETAARTAYRDHLRDVFRNRPLLALCAVHTIVALSGVAGPFVTAYCLRDVGLSFFGFGLVNAIATVFSLACAPLWGRVVDRVGCRPVIVLALLVMAPCGLVWPFIPPGAAGRAYCLLPWTFSLSASVGAGLNVALSTLIYKLSRPEGRSVQFAAYSSFVAIVAAPMPLLGGWLVTSVRQAGLPADLRLTFYLWVALIFVAALAANRLLREPRSVGTRELVFDYFPNWLAAGWDNVTATWPAFLSALVRFRLPGRGPKDE
jgi:MFS family permease